MSMCHFKRHSVTKNISYKMFVVLATGLFVSWMQLKMLFWYFFFYFFFYANHPLQGFRSHCSVRGYYSLRSPLPGPKPLLGQGDNTHTHTHTQPPTQPFITSKHDMKSLLVREQVDGSTVLSTKTKYIQGHSTKLLLPEGTMV